MKGCLLLENGLFGIRVTHLRVGHFRRRSWRGAVLMVTCGLLRVLLWELLGSTITIPESKKHTLETLIDQPESDCVVPLDEIEEDSLDDDVECHYRSYPGGFVDRFGRKISKRLGEF